MWSIQPIQSQGRLPANILRCINCLNSPSCSVPINIVLENSGEAYDIYNEAVEAWGQKDCLSALSEVNITQDNIKSCIAYHIEKKQADVKYPLEEVEKKYKESPDFAFLIGRISEFIRIVSIVKRI